jgi:hypothetical protein
MADPVREGDSLDGHKKKFNTEIYRDAAVCGRIKPRFIALHILQIQNLELPSCSSYHRR